MSISTSIRTIQQTLFAWVEEKGWHNKTRLEYLALLSAEVGEAINEARNSEVDENYYFELADIALRLFDLAEIEGINLYDYIERKMLINKDRIFLNKEK